MAIFYVNVDPNTALSKNIGFNAHSVIVDNYTAYWLYFQDADAYVAPFYIGVVLPLIRTTDYCKMEPGWPFGTVQPAPTVTSYFVHTVWTDANLAPSPGYLINDPTAVSPPTPPAIVDVQELPPVEPMDDSVAAQNLSQIGAMTMLWDTATTQWRRERYDDPNREIGIAVPNFTRNLIADQEGVDTLLDEVGVNTSQQSGLVEPPTNVRGAIFRLNVSANTGAGTATLGLVLRTSMLFAPTTHGFVNFGVMCIGASTGSFVAVCYPGANPSDWTGAAVVEGACRSIAVPSRFSAQVAAAGFGGGVCSYTLDLLWIY